MRKARHTGSQLTAIRRVSPSAPARHLHGAGLLRGRLLDYGCGHGRDADSYGMDRYDPHWHPDRPRGRYDTVTCTYVLNVLDPGHIRYVLEDIQGLLAPWGTAYLAVRRDLGGRTRRGRGTLQRNVVLPLPVVRETGGYCIYAMRRGVKFPKA